MAAVEATGNKLTMHYTRAEASEVVRQWLARGFVDVTDESIVSKR